MIRTHQARGPCTFIDTLLFTAKDFGVSSHLQEKRKWESVRPGRGGWAAGAAALVSQNLTRKQGSDHALFNQIHSAFTECLPWDRH